MKQLKTCRLEATCDALDLAFRQIPLEELVNLPSLKSQARVSIVTQSFRRVVTCRRNWETKEASFSEQIPVQSVVSQARPSVWRADTAD